MLIAESGSGCGGGGGVVASVDITDILQDYFTGADWGCQLMHLWSLHEEYW